MSLPPPLKKKVPAWIPILGVLAVLVAGGFGLWKMMQRAADSIAITFEKSAVRTIVQTVTATGKLQPEVEVKVTAEVSGQIVELPFREGARVKKGDLLVKIKPDLYQAQVDQQTAAVSMARSQAIRSQAMLTKAQADLKQYQDLHSRGLASDSDFLAYKTSCEAAQADYTAATAAVKQAEGMLGQARDSLAKTSVYAPMDGTVSSRSSELGESVVAQGSFSGTEIMRIADLSHMEVQVDVNENDIPHVKVGDPVVISIDAYPDRKFSGIVKEIGSSAANAGASGSGSAAQASASSDEVTNFLVKIRISDHDIQLRPGMSATADIRTQTVENAVAVPIQSVTVRAEGGLTSEELQKRQAKEAEEKLGNSQSAAAEREAARRNRETLQRVVFIKTGDTVKMQPVETGIADNTWIEIRKGVAPGEDIISGTYAAISRKLRDGSHVYVEKPKKDGGEGY
jgi:HlyD family secretion protein